MDSRDKTFFFMGGTAVAAAFSERLQQAGYKAAGSLTAAKAVFTYCLSQTELEDTYFDTHGLVQSAAPGTYLIDLSASTPSFARELSAVATVNDLVAIEAPLVVRDPSLARAFADPGNVAVYAACEEGELKDIAPMLAACASSVEVTGLPGSAQLARAAHSLRSAMGILALIESEALCRACSERTLASLDQGKAQGLLSAESEGLLSAVREGRFSGDYTVAMCMAELSAALMAADDVELILPGAEACLHLLELLATIGGSDMAPAALSLVYGEESACAEQGLDWTRAEDAYGEGGGGDGAAGGQGCAQDAAVPYPDYPEGFSGYSSN